MTTIIVPVYNAERYLRQCIESILSQSCRELEVLLIDDGSRDASGALCDGYAAKDPRVKAFHRQHAGVSAARNVGLAHAHGERLMFVDADDYLLPDAVGKLHAAVVDGVDLVLGQAEKFCEGSNTFSPVLEWIEDTIYEDPAWGLKPSLPLLTWIPLRFWKNRSKPSGRFPRVK